MYAPVPEEPLPDAFFNEEYLENDLRQKVDNLNELLLAIENIRATEKFERKNVVTLLGAVFEAQKALDEALFYGIPAERLEEARIVSFCVDSSVTLLGTGLVPT